jgi:hypothetical protein
MRLPFFYSGELCKTMFLYTDIAVFQDRSVTFVSLPVI